MSRDDYIQHSHRHGPKGTDPLDLTALGSGIVQLGGKMPWFETSYIISGAPSLTADDVHLADDFGGNVGVVQTTDNPGGFINVIPTPQVYTDGTFYSCDYSGSPEIAVQILQGGVYHMRAEFSIDYAAYSSGSPFFAAVGMQVATVSPAASQITADSRYFSDDVLIAGSSFGTPTGYLSEMAVGNTVAEKTFYVSGPASVQVFYLHTATLFSTGGVGIRFTIFRVSDGSGNSAPGSGSGSGLIYDFDNTGEWVYVEATGQGGPAVSGIQLLSSGTGLIRIDTTTDGTDIQVESAGALLLDSTYDATLRSFSGNVDVRVGEFGAIEFFVNDTTIAMRIESDGSIHIPTGTSIIADI